MNYGLFYHYPNEGFIMNRGPHKPVPGVSFACFQRRWPV